jgi:hypothetical protein
MSVAEYSICIGGQWDRAIEPAQAGAKAMAELTNDHVFATESSFAKLR